MKLRVFCPLVLLLLASGSLAAEKGTPVATGLWGGENVEMQVSEKGATLEFGCASGRVSEPLLADKGQFSARGTFRSDYGGPARKGAPAGGAQTVYTGTVAGDEMHLSFKVTGAAEAQGPFTLTRGQAGHVVKCQ